MPTKDPVERFFADLAAREHEPLLRKARGSTRFDVVDGGRTRRWLVTVDDGDITVRKGNGEATCAIRVEKPVLDRIGFRRGRELVHHAFVRECILQTVRRPEWTGPERRLDNA